MTTGFSVTFTITVLALSAHSQARIHNGVYSSSFVFLTADSPNSAESVRICANYLQYQTTAIAETAEKATPYLLQYWDHKKDNFDICNHNSQKYFDNNSIVPVNYRIELTSRGDKACINRFTSNQSAFREASQYEVDELKKANASAALLILDRGTQYVKSWRDFLFSDFTDPYINATEAIPTFFAYRKDLTKILALDQADYPHINIRLHRPPSSQWDASMIIIWLLAVGAVFGGGLWAFHRHNNGKDDSSHLNSHDSDENKGFCTRHANTLAIFVLMAVLVSILMLGYFFRPVLIIVFNLFLVLLGSFSVYGCANALLSNLKCSRPNCCVTPICSRFPEMNCISHSPSLWNIILYIACLALCTYWFIIRNSPYAWILLDFINFTMCLHILKSLRLPSLKWITGLMVCMFVYDAFMVFLTPYLTPSGCSVMLQVATGLDCSTSGGTGYPTPPIDANQPEKFPMLMQVMHFDPMLECVDEEVEHGYQMTILGLGDIIIPGYLISHCFTMAGFAANVRRLYGIICTIGYGVGLIITFCALTAMGIAQPALIYLVPATLLPVALTAVYRKEWTLVWNGQVNRKDLTLTPRRQASQPPTQHSGSTSSSTDEDHLVFEERVEQNNELPTIELTNHNH